MDDQRRSCLRVEAWVTPLIGVRGVVVGGVPALRLDQDHSMVLSAPTSPPTPPRGGSCLVGDLPTVTGADRGPIFHLTTLPRAGHGATSDCWGERDGRILCFVYIAGLLHFQQPLALRMACSPQYVAVNNKTK